jgi:hypothetical protein
MPADPSDEELLAFVDAMLSNLDRELREREVLAQAIRDARPQWVRLYHASLEVEDQQAGQ